MNGMVLWITGLPGSGKSTIANAIKDLHPGFTILRMDELRKTVTPVPSYSDFERELVYRSIVYLAKKITELGHNVIIDATGNMKRWRDFARQLIPGYYEIYLKCSIEECIKRERQRGQSHEAPRDIYQKGEKGWPVPGMDAPYEEPVNPEVVINVEIFSVKQAVLLIKDFLLEKLSF